jgi:N-methylhydantoinase A
VNRVPFRRLDEEFALLRRKAERDFHAEHWRGRLEHRPSVDVRYRGQGYELNIAYTRNLYDAFRREHERRYGYSYPSREIELVTLRLRASMKSAQAGLAAARVESPGVGRPGAIPTDLEHAAIFFGGKKLRAAIHDRDSLPKRKKLTGPAIVTEYSATTVIPSGKHFWLDRLGNLIIRI